MKKDGDEILLAIKEVVQQVLKKDDVKLTPELMPIDVDGWDSLAHVKIFIMLEKKLNIKFSTNEISTIVNMGDIIRIILQK